MTQPIALISYCCYPLPHLFSNSSSFCLFSSSLPPRYYLFSFLSPGNSRSFVSSLQKTFEPVLYLLLLPIDELDSSFLHKNFTKKIFLREGLSVGYVRSLYENRMGCCIVGEKVMKYDAYTTDWEGNAGNVEDTHKYRNLFLHWALFWGRAVYVSHIQHVDRNRPVNRETNITSSLWPTRKTDAKRRKVYKSIHSIKLLLSAFKGRIIVILFVRFLYLREIVSITNVGKCKIRSLDNLHYQS